MNLESLKYLLSKLKIPIVRDDGFWLTVSCPLAYRTDEDQDDEHPSCGISYGNSSSVVNCFACGSRPLSSVLYILHTDGLIDKDILKFFIENEFVEQETKQLQIDDIYDCDVHSYEPVPDLVLNRFVLADRVLLAKKYFTKRRISLKFLSNFYFYKKGIIFPIKDIYGNVYKLHFRSIFGKSFYYLQPKDFGLTGDWKRKDLWFGLDQIDLSKPIILVEGEFDALRLKTLGYHNVLASCGSVTKEQLRYLEELNPVALYLGFDSDKRGYQYTRQVISHLSKLIPIYCISWKVGGIKDAGDLKNRIHLDRILKKIKRVS